VKTLAILGVVVTHSVPVDWLVDSWAAYWVWQAVPLLVVLMGVNAYGALSRRGILDGGQRLNAGAYIRSRLSRLLVPFAVVWVVLLVAGVLQHDLYIGWMLALLRTPSPAPGSYFVALAVQLALVAPWLARWFERLPLVVLLVAIAATLSFELLAVRVAAFSDAPFLYSACGLRYIVLMVGGFWIERQRRQRRAFLTPLVVAFFGLGAAYLAYVNLTGDNLVFLDAWRWQNLPSFGYTVGLVALALAYLPERGSGHLARGAEWMSRSSYHIYLFQMLWFALTGLGWKPPLMPVNLLACAVGGLAAYRAEAAVRRLVDQRRRWLREPRH
jgi:peptidoglycan/LPS O-acetylase OafA/YrhL